VLPVLLAFVATEMAQAPDPAGDNAKGWTLFEGVEDSSNSFGQVYRLDTTAAYAFNKYFGVDAGVPVYFVHASPSTSGMRSTNGLGDVYIDLNLTFLNPVVNYASALRGTAPTGDTSSGLSTGRATYDWTNHFDRSFSRLTPFADLGIANTVADTSFLVRPFTTLGTLAHFEAGARLKLARYLSATALAYDVLPTGQQRIFSKLIPRPSAITPPVGPASHARVFETAAETVGASDLARDNGFSAGLDLAPASFLDLGIGYTRSVLFRLDTLWFGVGIIVASLVQRARGQ
jgi:hypothetical protein